MPQLGEALTWQRYGGNKNNNNHPAVSEFNQNPDNISLRIGGGVSNRGIPILPI